MDCLSPIDGRYQPQVEGLRNLFSEFSLNKSRIAIEIEYLIYLGEIIPELKQLQSYHSQLRAIATNFSREDFLALKKIEGKTQHDVKAVEYFLREQFTEGLSQFKEFIHFGLTSEDINALTYSLAIRSSVILWIEKLQSLINLLEELSTQYNEQVVLASTHGQPASPTTVGKEIEVFSTRLKRQLKFLKSIDHSAKFGGAVGNLNAHYLAYPQYDWDSVFDNFLETKFDLKRNQPTTQIDHNDNFAEIFDNLKRINVILIDLATDFWLYISKGYFFLEVKQEEVGSSTMPHKVNPISFENAEGNLLLANELLGFFSKKLPCSRLQRDLSSSTVIRNVGMTIGYMFVAINNLSKGLKRIKVDSDAIYQDIEKNPAVITEGIQTVLRRYHVPNAYDECKKLARKEERVSFRDINNFIDELPVNAQIKEELKVIHPLNYLGNCDLPSKL